MKIRDIRQKNSNELQRDLAATQEKIRQLRFKHAVRELKNTGELKTAKKIVAKIMTVLKEREQSESEQKI